MSSKWAASPTTQSRPPRGGNHSRFAPAPPGQRLIATPAVGLTTETQRRKEGFLTTDYTDGHGLFENNGSRSVPLCLCGESPPELSGGLRGRGGPVPAG